MRFNLGPIPEEFIPDESWVALREPGPLVMQACALPLGLGAAFEIGYCWHLVSLTYPLKVETHPSLRMVVGGLLLFIPALVLIHELIHALAYPSGGFTRSTVLGAWPSKLVFYAHYSGALSRNRFIFVFIAPFLFITLLPLILASYNLLPPSLKLVAMWASTLNALMACGDLLGIVLFLFQIPKRALVQNQGWRTYWTLEG